MAKASLNMLTRTSAEEMLDTDRILMTAVDTGWITDERPHDSKVRMVAEGWHAVEYDHGRVGQRRTFSKQQREVATMNRAPGRVDRLGRQGGLFG
jgi:NAD(P)-dependent dehydrogenase (short-subunit alcohol dehydrogenase family)